MTGDHVQDLLLDLAYGELPPDRAAEVEAHLATCEVCRDERDELLRTRALLAPLRSLEEPPPGFDERIVKSARAEAGLQADGTPGPTIEVSGSVKPLGLQAGRVDPLAPGVRVAKKEISKRTLWLRRATVGASIAGAAAVALFVASSVQQKRVDRAEEVPELKVRAPGVAGAPASSESAQAKVPQKTGSAPQAPMPAPQGSGGDLAAHSSAPVAPAQPAPRRQLVALKKAEEPARQKTAAPPPAKDDKEPVPAAGSAKTFEDAKPSQPPPPFREASRATSAAPAAPAEKSTESAPAQRQRVAVAQSNGAAVGGQPLSTVPADGLARTRTAANPNPDQLEESAGEARRAGSYPRAAELYQLAAGLRRSKNDSSRAAWDLAHAVECLAAASQLREAGDIRTELMRSYPSEEGPLRAADRALGWPAKARP